MAITKALLKNPDCREDLTSSTTTAIINTADHRSLGYHLRIPNAGPFIITTFPLSHTMDLSLYSPRTLQTVVMPALSHQALPLRELVAHLPMSSTILQPLSSASSQLTQIMGLPNEIVSKICYYFTILDTIRFSQTCRFARDLFSEIPEWKKLILHAHTAIVTIVATGLAEHTTFSQLYDALTEDPVCQFCQNPRGAS